MAVREITETTIEQTCEVCRHDRTLNLDDLDVGIAIEGHINPDVIPLPPCESCGAIEYLIPSAEGATDHPAQGSFGHRHAILVDVLHARLVQRGRVTSGIDVASLKKKKHSPEEIDRWFKDGLKLSSPAESPSNAEGPRKS